VIYLTPDNLESGAEAAAALSVKGHAVEVRCEVEVESTDLTGPVAALPLFGPDGDILRPGGGREYVCKGPTLHLKHAPQWKHLTIP